MSLRTLFPAALSSRLDGDARAAIDGALLPFITAGVLSELDGLVVARLLDLSGRAEPDLALALALAVRAPAHGHVCVRLATLTLSELLPELEPAARAAAEAQLRAGWPADTKAWADRVASAAPLVRLAPPPGEPIDAPDSPFVWDAGQLYSDRWWRYQRQLGDALQARAGRPITPLGAGVEAGLDLLFRPPGDTPEPPGLNRQRVAGALAVLRTLAVISGGPGMGKTWTVRNVLALLWLEARQQPGAQALRVALAAPTGKAAARMRESLRSGLDADFLRRLAALAGGDEAAEEFRAFVNALQPRTLHRLLGWRPDRPTRFRHDADHPLPLDVVVVDEASMVDLALMCKLTVAVPPEARLVLLGDRNQLASVDAGTVLADICGPTSSETLQVPDGVAQALGGLPGWSTADDLRPAAGGADLQGCVVQLNRTYRFRADSGIGAFAGACLRRPFDAQAALGVLEDPARADVARLPGISGEALPAPIRAAVLDGYGPPLRRLLAGYPSDTGECVEAWHRQILDELDGFRVLAAHRRGRAGVAGLNASIAALLTDALPGLTATGPRAWLGRPVLILENAYAVGRFNGDVGIGLTRCGDPEGRLVIAFPGPDAPPKGVPPDEVAARVAAGELRLVDYLEPARLPAWQPVYAMTIHKSQGSEFDHAMVVLPEKVGPILTRELLYTAVTRARRQVTVVGSSEVLRAGLERRVRRASGLAATLWGGDAPGVEP